MNKISITILFVIFAFSNLKAEELLKNGDLSRGSSGWKGDRKIEKDDDDNKYIAVRVDADEMQVFKQEGIDSEGHKDIIIKFKYKVSSDYEGRGVTLRIRRPKAGSTYRTIDLKNNGKWNDYTWDFSQVRNAEELTFVVEVLEGKGTVYFDDFSITPK